MLGYNSTISIKLKPCAVCGKKSRIFSKGRCQPCANLQDTLARDARNSNSEEGLPDLIHQLDDLVSKYVRLSAASDKGECECYTCGKVGRWQNMHAGHYISRKSMFLRFDTKRNIRVQCPTCNCHKYGQSAIFGQNLEKEMPNITEVLYEESLTVYKYDRSELQSMISNYRNKVNNLLKQLKQ